ncbi:hypothetical protein C8Q69DRAFT_328289 [Paecilomyces variotii]|uniref:Uncharacterized protein n=1 Tax=Byssochlamys spectabilis TaxID=264951 RepID=A0A443HP88_BYSSP|nr:hypothetical protein C8Q69DRAFT_328289 [Paecilomyces variotii]KAJ9351069.1 hypothetical protein DTO280E4_8364 [Paecilomyces variotii]RWQ93584.1 hypothetical protein C8Q69DRAFT_328289 [Paecilomyces variotii]
MNERRVTRRARGDVYTRDNKGLERRRVPQAGLNRPASGIEDELDGRSDEENESFFAYLKSRKSMRTKSSPRDIARDNRRALVQRHTPSSIALPTGSPGTAGEDEAVEDMEDVTASDSQSASSSDEEADEEQQNSPGSPGSAGVPQITASPPGAPTVPTAGSIRPMPHGFPRGLQSTPEKVGLVVGLTVGCAVIVFIVVFFVIRRKRSSNYLRSRLNGQRSQHRPTPSGPIMSEKSWPESNQAGWDVPNELKMARDQAMNKSSVGSDLESNRSNNRPPSLRSRLLRGPLTSNPLSPMSPKFFLRRSSAARSSNGSDNLTARTPRSPATAALANRSHLSLGTESDTNSRDSKVDYEISPFEKELSIEPLSPPPKVRKPGVSYFSWSTAPTTPGTGVRDTLTTQDGEPPRFRTINSWVNHQSRRQTEIGDKHPSTSYAPPPIPESNSVNRYPPYPPTPPIAHREPDTPTTPRTPRTPGTPARIQRSTLQSFMSRHNRTMSSTTTSTLPIFRQHPGEEVPIPRPQRIRSSSLRNVTPWLS